MNIAHFFKHWNIIDNPFKGEEARHDAIFARIGLDAQDSPAAHSDFDKILGDLAKPSTSIVFGEKGSGKTAIRMQLTRRVREHNQRYPERRVFLISYDDLNPFLEQLHARLGGTDPAASLRAIRLVDHLDALLALATTDLCDALFETRAPDNASPPPDTHNALGPDATRIARSLNPTIKSDLRIAQAIYDLRDTDGHRATRLRSILRTRRPATDFFWNLLLFAGWMPSAALVAWVMLGSLDPSQRTILAYTALALATIYLLTALKRFLWDRFGLLRLTRRIRKQRRVLPRDEAAIAASLADLPKPLRASIDPADHDAARYALLASLRRALEAFGYSGIMVLLDRVDEPTLVSGDTQRMQSIVWPMLNNKFLQQENLGIKMLLPIELRYALFKESSSFFQEARLDKQSLIERLSWTGAMLYDLASARLAACRPADAEPISILDLFAQDVSRQDLVDALDQMHQPRDALKFLYRCLNEHCSNVTAEEGSWRVPKLVLDNIRRQEVDRVQQLYRGIRPA